MTQSTGEAVVVTTQAETPRKHCWECLRRRLVCDSVRPVCNRCRTSGIVCPGYEEKQPLRWVKPGRVTARTRRRPKASVRANNNNNKNKKSQDDPEVDTDVIDARIEDRHASTNGHGSDDELWSKFSTLSVFDSKTIDALMRYDVACENFAGVEASYIYNCEVYERASPLSLLLEEQYKLPMAKIAVHLPAPIRALFILFTLGHQIHQFPHDVEENVRVKANTAVTFWTYQVVRTLNEAIAQEKADVSDQTITAVLMLMMADQQLHPSGRWRFHHSGLMRMVQLRGGIEKVWNDRPHMHNGVLTMVVGEVFANTTSPSNDQLVELTHPKNLDFLQSAWTSSVPSNSTLSVYVGSICPPSLFSDIIRINHLRALATRGICYSTSSSLSSSTSSSSPQFTPTSSPSASSCSEDDMPVYTDAQTLLNRILNFSPESYAETNGNERTQSKWLLVARVHQSAVVLYCILSLQNILLLPETESISRTMHMHYDRLLLDLKEGYQYRELKSCFFWPLVVAGVAAVHGTAFERAFIADLLKDSVPHMGSSMPILARMVLTTFWDSGKKSWDDCFDKPYIFLT